MCKRRELRGAGGGATIPRAARAGLAADVRSCSARSSSPNRRASPASATHALRGGWWCGGRTPQHPPSHRAASREDRRCGMTSTHRRHRRETKVEPVREHERCVRVALPDSIAFECHHPLLSVSLRQSSDGQFIPRGRRRNAAVPSSPMPISRLAVTRSLSSYEFLLRRGRECAGRASRTCPSFGLGPCRRFYRFRIRRCAVPRRARGGRESHRRRRRGRPGAAARRASRARTPARRATSSGSAPRRRLRRRDPPRR